MKAPTSIVLAASLGLIVAEVVISIDECEESIVAVAFTLLFTREMALRTVVANAVAADVMLLEVVRLAVGVTIADTGGSRVKAVVTGVGAEAGTIDTRGTEEIAGCTPVKGCPIPP